MGRRADQHQGGRVGRLLQRLEQRVLSLHVHRLGVEDERELAAGLERFEGEPFLQPADLGDLDLSRRHGVEVGATCPAPGELLGLGQDDDHVGVAARHHPPARTAGAARVAVGLLAVGGLRQREGGQLLADPRRSAEEVAVVQLAALDGGPQRGDGPVLADDVLERHWGVHCSGFEQTDSRSPRVTARGRCPPRSAARRRPRPARACPRLRGGTRPPRA